MKIGFAGQLYGNELLDVDGISNNSVSYAIQKFNKNFVDALSTRYEVVVMSPVKTKRRHMTGEIHGKVRYRYLFYSGVLGRIHLLIQSIAVIWREKPKVIFVDALNISQGMGAVIAQLFHKVKIISIVTDIPEDVLQNKKSVYASMFDKILRYSKGYVFLTKLTNDKFNTENKPSRVLEGIARENKLSKSETIDVVCVYAGGLNRKYYIEQLAGAFAEIAKNNEYLYFFGDGECKESIISLSKICPQIKYKGIVSNDEIVEYETNATLLINPRPNIGAYTKYSFPSKIIEYMAVGTPILANKLDGIPDEFYEYMYLFDGYSQNDYSTTLRRILDLEEEARGRMGSEAKNFILTRNGIEKASVMIEELINEVQFSK